MDKVQEEFEKWLQSTTDFDTYRTNYAMTKPENQQYMCHHTNLAWFAWKASRESIVVKIPKEGEASSFGNYIVFDYESVVKMLEEAGVRYE